jgi:hypothetical protein
MGKLARNTTGPLAAQGEATSGPVVLRGKLRDLAGGAAEEVDSHPRMGYEAAGRYSCAFWMASAVCAAAARVR